jgi:nucleotide-binding universal stress UspA family protein
MPFNSLLVLVDGGHRDAETLGVAARLAGRFKAHLRATFTVPTALLAASAMDPAAVGALIEFQIETETALLTAAKAACQAAESRFGIAIEWRVSHHNATANIARQARYADLLVMAQPDPADWQLMAPSPAADIVIDAGRPVLMVPYAGRFAGCGSSVLIAWDSGREATRAIADALPLLQATETINIVAFDGAEMVQGNAADDADLRQWLLRHGVVAAFRHQPAADLEIGEQLLSLAADLGSDLIVMGAYGHSRTREMVMGGMTRTLLRSMTVPVLFSH